MALQCELRRRASGFLVAAVIVALAGGATLAAVAGARRSDSAYERYRSWARPAHITVGSGDVEPEEFLKQLRAVEAAPWIDKAVHIRASGARLRGPNGKVFEPFEVQLLADQENLLARDEFEREKVLHGRHARPEATDEVTISFSTASLLGAELGDTIEVLDGDATAPVLVKVVGVVARSAEFPTVSGTSKPSVATTSGFLREHPEFFGTGDDSLLVRVRDGVTESELTTWFQVNAPGTAVFPSEVVVPAIERTIRIETVAWWLVAGLLALVFFVLVGQVLLRNAASRADDVAMLAVLGMTRRRILMLGAMRGAVIGAAGALVAVVVAILVSPLTPAGLARIAEPAPGVRVDGRVLALGAVAIVLVAVLFGAGAAARAHALTRSQLRRHHALPLPGAPTSVFTGLAFLFRPFQRREVNVTWTTIGSLCFVVATLVGVTLTLSSLSRVQHDDRLVGATWDAYVALSEGPVAPDVVDAARDRVARAPGVETATKGAWVFVKGPDPDFVGVQVFDDPNVLAPAIAAGRVPTAAGEIAMGADEMKRFNAGLGDKVRLITDDEGHSTEVTIVGRSVLVPPLIYEAGPGDSIATNGATAWLMGLEDEVNLLLVHFASGADPEATLDAVRAAGGENVFIVTSAEQTVSDGIRRVGTVPRSLVVVLVILGLVALVHLLLVSTRRRRLNIVVLRALGFTRGQVVTATVTQAVAVAVVAIAVGVPVGVLAGRVAWRWFADYLRVVPVVTVPGVVLAGVIGTVFLAALVAAIPAGARAARLRPAQVLRTEG